MKHSPRLTILALLSAMLLPVARSRGQRGRPLARRATQRHRPDATTRGRAHRLAGQGCRGRACHCCGGSRDRGCQEGGAAGAQEQREAIDQFNQRLAERDETLEKWKGAYEEAATVARTKDAERAKFEAEASTYKASTKSATAKNKAMYKAGHELLQQYQSVTIGDIIVAHEPAFGLRRVEIQNRIQDTGDKLLDRKVNP